MFLREQFEPGGLAGRRHRAGNGPGRRAADRESRAADGQTLSREARAKVARTVWRDAGAVKADQIRLSFIRIANAAGLPGQPVRRVGGTASPPCFRTPTSIR